MIQYTNRNGETLCLESPFETNVEAASNLWLKIDNGTLTGDFPLSIWDAFRRFGERISTAQSYWLHKLAMDPQPQESEGTYDLSGITSLFETAKEHLKHPKIILQTEEGTPVKISLAGERSKYTGQIMVSGPQYGSAWYGRIDLNGDFFPGKDSSEEIKSLLTSLSQDPQGIAANHGRLTGNCCFCNRVLEDERSTSVGYGPVCADNYGLDWG